MIKALSNGIYGSAAAVWTVGWASIARTLSVVETWQDQVSWWIATVASLLGIAVIVWTVRNAMMQHRKGKALARLAELEVLEKEIEMGLRKADPAGPTPSDER